MPPRHQPNGCGSSPSTAAAGSRSAPGATTRTTTVSASGTVAVESTATTSSPVCSATAAARSCSGTSSSLRCGRGLAQPVAEAVLPVEGPERVFDRVARQGRSQAARDRSSHARCATGEAQAPAHHERLVGGPLEATRAIDRAHHAASTERLVRAPRRVQAGHEALRSRRSRKQQRRRAESERVERGTQRTPATRRPGTTHAGPAAYQLRATRSRSSTSSRACRTASGELACAATPAEPARNVIRHPAGGTCRRNAAPAGTSTSRPSTSERPATHSIGSSRIPAVAGRQAPGSRALVPVRRSLAKVVTIACRALGGAPGEDVADALDELVARATGHVGLVAIRQPSRRRPARRRPPPSARRRSSAPPRARRRSRGTRRTGGRPERGPSSRPRLARAQVNAGSSARPLRASSSPDSVTTARP